MRRIVFEDPELPIKVWVDIEEEMYQDMKEDFGEKNLKIYIGLCGKSAIDRNLKPFFNKMDVQKDILALSTKMLEFWEEEDE